MDQRLTKRLFRIDQQLDVLRAAELEYLELEANRKAIWSNIFLHCEGSSVAEREAKAYAHQDWQDFMKGHVNAEVVANMERRKYELLLKALDCEYLSIKNEGPAMSRQSRGAV